VSAPHIDDDLLDQFAFRLLRPELPAPFGEYLLICPHCQTRLIALDQFAWLFRAAATQPDARPRPLSRRLFNARILTWTGAAAMVAAVFSLIFVKFRKSPVAPATVLMHALRGPEAAAAISVGNPARLVFDLTPTGTGRDYEVRIVNLLGTQVLAIPVEFNDAHLNILIKKLVEAKVWTHGVRIYGRANSDSGVQATNRIIKPCLVRTGAASVQRLAA